MDSFFATILAAVLGALALTAAEAQELNPGRPITIIVPFAAGGATDVVMRAAGQRLSQRLNMTVLVDNRPGASGAIGVRVGARAEPDGHTLATISAPLVQNQAIFKQPGYDFAHDFIPLANLAAVPILVVAKADSKLRTMDDLFAHAKAHPGTLSIGTSSPPQIAYLRWGTQLDLNAVPYRGSSLIVNDVVAGQIELGNIVYSDIAPHLETGKVRALFATSLKRISTLPDLPVLAERVPGFESISWFGLGVPANTPKTIVDRLKKELVDIARSDEFREFLSKLYLLPIDSPADLETDIKNELEKWKRLVKDGIVAQQ
ncbi:MAG: tripartite tricarboxylate transporter substrate binding protein [Variibacter sp.]|nr:tripartite tricarboxylate transporter substrate binding protein [Variibacter sp.]